MNKLHRTYNKKPGNMGMNKRVKKQKNNNPKNEGRKEGKKVRKKKLVTTWKRYWFVLKDQLLLYYKSQAECLNLSACRGSLNMGLVSSVRPGAHRGPPATAAQGFTIEVETRTQVVVLRTKHRNLQEQWLKALLESVALPNISSPVRTVGGPVHFRYSMENLPVIEEAKTEDKKEQTLPHQTSITSQDTVLGRIKRIGGQSYGGSLDTILRHQPKTQKQQQWSPQQPKIPRIKAVDRMLGVRYLDSTENTEILISENQTHGLVNEEICPSDSTCSASKDEVLLPNGREEIECNEVLLYRPVATSSDIQEVREINFKLRDDERNKQIKVAIFERGENKNHEKPNILSIEKARKYTTDFLENERYVYSSGKEEEILVENKLYENTKAVENEDRDKIYEETKETEQKFDCAEVENKLYEKNKPDKEDKQYDSLEEFILSHVHEIPEDEKIYEVVSATVDAVKQVENVQSLEDKEEDDYYCSYDKFSLMHLLSDQRNSSSPEPDLPPRPSGGSIDSPKGHLAHEDTKTNDEEADYNVYYESTESYNSSTSPAHLLSNGDGSEKKGSKLRVRMKLRKKKPPSKESVSSEDGNKNNKRKRKISFLRRMLRHYRKKPEYNSEAVVISDSCSISAEPEYESVDYLASMLKHEVTEEELPEHASRSKSIERLDKAVFKEKLFGKKNLLTEQAMNELKMKLKCRDNAALIEPPVYTKEENKGHEGLSPNEILEKNPVPTPRSKKERVNQDNKDLVVVSSRYRCNDSITRENKPPSLPPRRVARPRSPWHDVPKNNSPVYGNVQDLCIITGEKKEDKNEESPGSTFEKQSGAPLSKGDQEFRDELLGTPCGFVYVQNKWKTAEKSSERFHDQQGNKGNSSLQKSPQEEFLPGKCSNTAELEAKHGRITSNDLAKSDILGYQHKADPVFVVNIGSSVISNDISKEDLSANVITKDSNSQTEKLIAKDDNLSDTYSQMADDKLSYEKREGPKVPKNDIELQYNGNLTVKVGCTKTEHSDTSDDRIVNKMNGVHKNLDLNTTHHEDFSDDISLTLRKSQTDIISVCNRSEILCNETTKFLVLVGGENENSSSSLCHNAGDSTELKEETKDKAHITINDCVCSDSSSISTDSLVPEEIKTLCHTACSQKILLNEMVKNFSDRAIDTTETAAKKDTTLHLHRHSDELNILLAQLAEITSAPLMPHGVASSLVDIPETRNPKPEANELLQLDSTQQESVQKELLLDKVHV